MTEKIPSTNDAYVIALMDASMAEFRKTGKFNKSRIRRAAKAAEKANTKANIAADRALRPGVPANWARNTAKDINNGIQNAVWQKLKEAKKFLKSQVSELGEGQQLQHVLIAAPALAVSGAQPAFDGRSSDAVTRRSFITGAVSAIGVGLAIYPQTAQASNTGFVSTVLRHVRSLLIRASFHVEKAREAIEGPAPEHPPLGYTGIRG